MAHASTAIDFHCAAARFAPDTPACELRHLSDHLDEVHLTFLSELSRCGGGNVCPGASQIELQLPIASATDEATIGALFSRSIPLPLSGGAGAECTGAIGFLRPIAEVGATGFAGLNVAVDVRYPVVGRSPA